MVDDPDSIFDPRLVAWGISYRTESREIEPRVVLLVHRKYLGNITHSNSFPKIHCLCLHTLSTGYDIVHHFESVQRIVDVYHHLCLWDLSLVCFFRFRKNWNQSPVMIVSCFGHKRDDA